MATFTFCRITGEWHRPPAVGDLVVYDGAMVRPWRDSDRAAPDAYVSKVVEPTLVRVVDIEPH